MRWESFELWGMTEGNADELGNPTLTPGKICDAKGRITQWSAEEISIEGRDFTNSHRKVITSATRANCISAKTVKVDGKEYDIISTEDLGRWRLLIVRGWRI